MASAPMYGSFAVVTLLVLALLVLLARASQAMLAEPDGEYPDRNQPDEDETPRERDADAEMHDDGTEMPEERPPERERSESNVPATGAARIERHARESNSWNDPPEVDIETDDEGPWRDDDAESPWGDNEAEADARRAREAESFSTGALLANVALSQGLFGAVLVGAAWLAEIPLVAFGVALGDPWNAGLPALGVGAGLGVALYVANELSANAADAAGIDYSEGLRESLAPDTVRGWAVLLGVVLPIIAGFEELLFRAALVGAFAAGFGVSPWALAVFSTVAFAVGHGAQGPGGVAVTGLLGFALAAAFVLTGSLLVVIVAHYLVNALEFVVHEGLGVEWT